MRRGEEPRNTRNTRSLGCLCVGLRVCGIKVLVQPERFPLQPERLPLQPERFPLQPERFRVHGVHERGTSLPKALKGHKSLYHQLREGGLGLSAVVQREGRGPQPWGDSVARTPAVSGAPYRASEEVRPEAEAEARGRPPSLPPAPAREPSGGHQRQGPNHPAIRLRLTRCRVLHLEGLASLYRKAAQKQESL